MRDLRIDFTKDKPVILLEEITGSEQLLQKTFVNLCTATRSDPIYQDRGTRLFYDAATGNLFSREAIIKSAILAAHTTLKFVKQFQYPDYKLENIRVEINDSSSQKNQAVTFDVSATINSQTTITELTL